MISLNQGLSAIAVIGTGGVASWLIRPLVMLLNQCEHKPRLILMDQDTIERRNLDRQWFTEDDIGKNKAEAMASSINYPDLIAIPEWYFNGTMLPVEGDVLFLGCADNHAARRAILSAVDRGEGWAIIAGNEYEEAEAYYYEKGWENTSLDPRTYFPSINTDMSGDPTRPRGCTGEAAEAAPQLVLANLSAANHALWLFWHHFVQKHQDREYLAEFSPIRTWNYSTKFMTHRACDLEPKAKEQAA